MKVSVCTRVRVCLRLKATNMPSSTEMHTYHILTQMVCMHARRPRQVPGPGVHSPLAEGVCSMPCCLPGRLLPDNQLLRESRHGVCSSCRAWPPRTYVTTAAPGCSTSGSRACPMPTGKHISSTTNAAALRLATACATGPSPSGSICSPAPTQLLDVWQQRVLPKPIWKHISHHQLCLLQPVSSGQACACTSMRLPEL